MAAKFIPCSIEHCNRNAHRRATGRRGWCAAHYWRWLHYGDPNGVAPSRSIRSTFIQETVLAYNGDDCLIWPFQRSGGGYAKISIKKRSHTVSRMVCESVNGSPPTPLHQAAHSCGNGHLGCVAPSHLSWKTQAENEADKLAHGTDNRGERSARAKLTASDVQEIMRLSKTKTRVEIGRMFGVHSATIGKIILGRRWSGALQSR